MESETTVREDREKDREKDRDQRRKEDREGGKCAWSLN